MNITDIKFRTIISKYNKPNEPDVSDIKGKVFNTAEEARVCLKEFAEEMYDNLISAKVFNKGYDPLGYCIEEYNEVSCFIRHNNLIFDEHLGCPSKSFMYKISIHPVVCYFTDQVNKITYRAMDIIQFMGN